jgi:hypothetical protein
MLTLTDDGIETMYFVKKLGTHQYVFSFGFFQFIAEKSIFSLALIEPSNQHDEKLRWEE